MTVPSSPSLNCLDLTIAGICIRIESDFELKKSEEFLPFFQCHKEPDVGIRFRQVIQLPPYPTQAIYKGDCYCVYPDGKGGYLRTFSDTPLTQSTYAVATYDYDRGQVYVDYLPKGIPFVSDLHNCFFHLGFEAVLIHFRRLCLHASCVNTALGGILFSGVSGIGKSTQANLWCNYRNAVQINGDRPILVHAQNAWFACGSPYAGSSRIHTNASCPVTAIVMLKQAHTCSLRRLSLPEAFRAIWSGLTMHSWNEKLVALASDLTIDLVSTVPVFEFACTPNETAVSYLEQELRKECRL